MVSVVLDFYSPGADGAAASGGASASGGAGTGNSGGAASGAVPNRVLGKRTLGQIEVSPMKGKRSQSSGATLALPDNAVIIVAVRKYSDEAKDLVSALPGGMALFQVRVKHGAKPCMEDGVIKALDAYFAVQNSKDETWPKSVKKFQEQRDCRIVVTKPDQGNPEGAPLEAWRLTGYVAGTAADAANFVSLLKGYTEHRAVNPVVGTDRRPWPSVGELRMEVHLHTGIDAVAFSALSSSPGMKVAVEGPKTELPLNPFGVAPPTGQHVLVAEVAVQDENNVIVAWEGRTYQFKQRLAAMGIEYHDDVRITGLDQRDMRTDGNIELVCGIFTNVFHNMTCNVRLDASVVASLPEGSAAAALVKKLKELPALVFNAF